MPPRRSCFFPRIRPRGSGSARFQCHHGVPASRSMGLRGRFSATVSMPPRRSCFKETDRHENADRLRFNATTAFLLPAGGDPAAPGLRAFQCHHGVPASRLPGRSLPRGRRRFNATTAFLLLRASSSARAAAFGFQCHHGVPASLPILPAPLPVLPVSMPPRRSCFPSAKERAKFQEEGFNATTAFLLRRSSSDTTRA